MAYFRPTLTIYPLGNADCSLLTLPNGHVVIIDYAATGSDDPSDKRINLPVAVKRDLGPRRQVDVLAISHLDRDHYAGVSEFFELTHASKYRGGGRIAINELWVPAAVILEQNLADEARVIQAEAQYRLKAGYGIRIFSQPDSLDSWLRARKIDPTTRRNLLTDAGNLIPGFDSASRTGEFFVHSPFAEAAEDGAKIVRNATSLVLHVTFEVAGRRTGVFLGADIQHEDLSKIVTITESKSNQDRLRIDVAKLPHHCSYLSLGPEKGLNTTMPAEPIRRLYKHYTRSGVTLVSTSEPIPSLDSDEPPHRQAANFYKIAAEARQGEFKVTMEHPWRSMPEPLLMHIGDRGIILKKDCLAAGPDYHQPARRAG